MSFDFAPIFVFAGLVISNLWLALVAPAGILVGFWLVRRIRWKLAHRAGVERARAKRW